MKKNFYYLSFIILFLINIVNVNAKVIDYQFMGKKVNETFVINSNSSLTANTFINVTEDSTNNYLVVDLCSTANNNISVSVPNDFDGSYTMFYKSYDLKESCSTGSYNGTIIRLFFNTTTFADSGNGNMAINNNITITNNASYNAVFKLISMGLSDTIDLSDLTINNQDIIINNINGLQNNFDNSLSNTEQNIQDSLNETKDEINSTINDNFTSCHPKKNLFNKSYDIHSGVTFGSNGSTAGLVGAFAQYSYIKVDPNTNYTISNSSDISSVTNYRMIVVEYNDNYEFILRNIERVSNTYTFKTSSNTRYVRISSMTVTLDSLQFEKGSTATSYSPYEEICDNKLDNLNDTQKETNNKLDNLNDNITDSDSSGATSDAENFFSNFTTDTFGLTSVITAPLELIKSVTSKSCTPLQLNVPFVNKELNLPCLSTIYESHFDTFLTIYRTITFGFVSYWVCIKIFNLVKDFKNPEHDEIEVLDL